MTIYQWEIIVYAASILSIVGSLTIVVFAGKWILKTYFPKKE